MLEGFRGQQWILADAFHNAVHVVIGIAEKVKQSNGCHREAAARLRLRLQRARTAFEAEAGLDGQALERCCGICDAPVSQCRC